MNDFDGELSFTKKIEKPSVAVRCRGEVFISPLHVDARDACKARFPDIDSNEMEEGYMIDNEFVDKNEAYAMDERERKER